MFQITEFVIAAALTAIIATPIMAQSIENLPDDEEGQVGVIRVADHDQVPAHGGDFGDEGDPESESESEEVKKYKEEVKGYEEEDELYPYEPEEEVKEDGEEGNLGCPCWNADNLSRLGIYGEDHLKVCDTPTSDGAYRVWIHGKDLDGNFEGATLTWVGLSSESTSCQYRTFASTETHYDLSMDQHEACFALADQECFNRRQ